MEVFGILLFVLIIRGVFGGVCAAIASNKGRSTVGWFFGGFFLDLIAIILVACLPNLKTQKAKEDRVERENRRLREQLRQEQIKSESFRQHTSARLDAHDSHLGLDTRHTLPDNAGAPAQLEAFGGAAGGGNGSASLESASGDLAQLAGAVAPSAPPRPHRNWHYEQFGEARGPIEEPRLIAMLQSGELDAQTLVWNDAMTDWQPVDAVHDLRPHATF